MDRLHATGISCAPYRTSAKTQEDEKALPWYLETPPTEQERKLWVSFYDTWRVWSNGKVSNQKLFELTDNSMKQYRMRFGIK